MNIFPNTKIMAGHDINPCPAILYLILQMKHSLFNLLSSSLIPELCHNISTSTSCNIHVIMITVSAVRAFPYKLSIIISYNLNLSCVATFLTVITLSIKLRIHNIIINVLHNLKYCRDVILHIRNLNIADSSTW